MDTFDNYNEFYMLVNFEIQALLLQKDMYT